MVMSDLRGLVQLDEQGRVDEDVACVRCGYNLRSLDPDAHCPECGMAVHQTLRLDKLRGFDVAWLRRTARAMLWISASVTGLAVMMAINLWNLVFRTMVSVWWGGLMAAGFAVMLGAGLYGCWCGSAPPGALMSSGAQTYRRLGRWGMTAGLGFIFALIIAAQFLENLDDRIATTIGGLSFGSLVVGTWGMLMYASRLAKLIPQRRLAIQAKLVAWGYAIAIAVFVAIMVQESIGPPIIPAHRVVYAMALLLLCSVWSLPLLWWYRKRFLEAAKLAEQREGA